MQRVVDMSWRSVKFFGDFGEKLTAFNLHGAKSGGFVKSVQTFGDFGEKLSVSNNVRVRRHTLTGLGRKSVKCHTQKKKKMEDKECKLTIWILKIEVFGTIENGGFGGISFYILTLQRGPAHMVLLPTRFQKRVLRSPFVFIPWSFLLILKRPVT